MCMSEKKRENEGRVHEKMKQDEKKAQSERGREEEKKKRKSAGALRHDNEGKAGGGPHSHVDSRRPVRWQAVRAASQ